MAQRHLVYVDNLRILLITLVIGVHLSITYGGEGSWYYCEGRADTFTSSILTLHNAVAQCFFMGMLFFFSAYLAVDSCDRKGPGRFLRDRLWRLGVPLLVYEFVASPLLIYMLIRVNVIELEGAPLELLGRYYGSFHIGSGPTWFVETLLIFAAIYAVIRTTGPARRQASVRPLPPPGPWTILVFAVILGLATFAARLLWPIGWVFGPLNLQLCFFAQYIALMVVGVVARRGDWLGRLPTAAGRLWLGVAAGMILVVLPAVFILGGALEGNLPKFMGGPNWRALIYALWEQVTGIALIVGLIVLFRERFNRRQPWAAEASAASYATYLIHTPVVIVLALALRSIAIYPLLKFAIVMLIAVPLCFASGAVLRRLPLARRIL